MNHKKDGRWRKLYESIKFFVLLYVLLHTPDYRDRFSCSGCADGRVRDPQIDELGIMGAQHVMMKGAAKMSEEERTCEILESLVELMNNEKVEELEKLADAGHNLVSTVFREIQTSEINVIAKDGENKKLRDLDVKTVTGLVASLVFQWGSDIGVEKTEAAYTACEKEG